MRGSLPLILVSLVCFAGDLDAQRPGQSEPITRIEAILNHPRPTSLAGLHVDLSAVTIRRFLSDQVVLVGPARGKQLLVRMQELGPKLRTGQKLQISGIINQMPAQLQGWYLPPPAEKIVMAHPIFLNATAVQVGQAPKKR